MKRIFTALAVFAIFISSCKKDKDKAPPTTPLVTTAALSNVIASAGSATAGGSIVSDGGASVTKSGIVWSKTNNTPTITDTVVAAIATSGAFTVNISGIDFGNTYYFRAFATNSTGTGYGDVVTLTTSNDSVRFTYNGQSVTYGIITSPNTGKKWLDRNLGAKRVATALDDYQAYGDLFQWGRPADGHQLINWTSSTTGTFVNGTTTTAATTDIPNSNLFIIGSDATLADWRNDNNTNRWATNPQGPCPVGWHVPTIVEWNAERSANNTQDWTSSAAYGQLKLTHCGKRTGYNIGNGPVGAFTTGVEKPGSGAAYWSSTPKDMGGYFMGNMYRLAANFAQGENFNSDGSAIRCIKDN